MSDFMAKMHKKRSPDLLVVLRGLLLRAGRGYIKTGKEGGGKGKKGKGVRMAREGEGKGKKGEGNGGKDREGICRTNVKLLPTRLR